MYASLLGLAVVGSTLISALPTKVARDDPAASTLNETLKFENVTATSFGVPPDLPGIAGGLYFDNIELGPYNYAAGMPVGIAPQSFPNLIAFGHSFTETGPNTYGIEAAYAGITANYPNSNVTSFTFEDFYFGCQAEYNYTYPGGSQVMLYPQDCAMLVSGFLGDDLNGEPNATQVFNFTPDFHLNSNTGTYYSPMVHAVLPDAFKDMRTVTFSATSTNTSTSLSEPAVYMDSMSFFLNER